MDSLVCLKWLIKGLLSLAQYASEKALIHLNSRVSVPMMSVQMERSDITLKQLHS